MSIYATWLSIEDARECAAEMEAAGINYGVIGPDGPVEDLGELDPEELDAPIVYEGSHVLPADDDRRGGSVEVAAIPDDITREGRDDAPEGALKDWLRLSVDSLDSIETYRGAPYVEGGSATVVLTRNQVERLADTLTAWLGRGE